MLWFSIKHHPTAVIFGHNGCCSVKPKNSDLTVMSVFFFFFCISSHKLLWDSFSDLLFFIKTAKAKAFNVIKEIHTIRSTWRLRKTNHCNYKERPETYKSDRLCYMSWSWDTVTSHTGSSVSDSQFESHHTAAVPVPSLFLSPTELNKADIHLMCSQLQPASHLALHPPPPLVLPHF